MQAVGIGVGNAHNRQSSLFPFIVRYNRPALEYRKKCILDLADFSGHLNGVCNNDKRYLMQLCYCNEDYCNGYAGKQFFVVKRTT